MEDTKKLIEKYKRELMELSRSVQRDEPTPARQPQIIGYVDNVDEKTFNEAAMGTISQQRDTCGDKLQQQQQQQPVTETALSAPEPRVETDPELPYHHEPETPPPDYSNPPTAAEIDAVEAERIAERTSTPMPVREPSSGSVPIPTPAPSDQSVQMPVREPSNGSIPMPTPAPSPSEPETPPETVPDRTEQPDSGSSPEQKYEPPYNDPQMAQNEENSARYPDLEQNGSQSKPIDFPEQQYTSFEDFQSKNSGRGTMVFRITTAREALPVEGAKCVLTKKFGGIIYEIDALITDRSGQTIPRTLPAPPRSLSQQFDNLVQPFALYDATVTRDGYVDVVLTDIPVFDGVQSVQRVSMLLSASENMLEDISEVNNNAD